MCGKLLAIIIVLIAIVLAILGTVLPPERIDYVVSVSKFFDVMLPVLAVGALLKYLLCHSGKSCVTGCGTGCGDCKCCKDKAGNCCCCKCCNNGNGCKCCGTASCNKEGKTAGTCSINNP